MEVTFQLTPEDYWKTLRHQLRRATQPTPLRFLPLAWSFLYGILLGVGGMILYRYASEFYGTNSKQLIWGLWFALAGVIMLALNPYVSTFIYKRVLFQKGGYYCSPQTLVVEDSYLFHRCSATESKIAWSDVLTVEEDKGYLYVVLDRGLSIPIPRYSFQDRTAFHQFMAALTSHISPNG